MAILVTGGAGFIGSHVVDRLLLEGEEVVCIDDFNDFYSPKTKESNLRMAIKNRKFTLVRVDIRDEQDLGRCFKHGISKVIHLAARAGVRPSLENPELYEDVNVNGTAAVMKAARDAKVAQIIFASSSSVYGNNAKVPFSETDPLNGIISPYAASKRMAEIWVEQIALQARIPSICLRFFTVYGPRGRPDMAVAKFTDAILQGRKILLYGKDTARDYTYIEDIVDGIMASIKLKARFEIINLGNSRPVHLKELVNEIELATGKKSISSSASMQPGDVKQTFADIRKARKLLGYSPKTSIRDGIRKYVKWLSEK